MVNAIPEKENQEKNGAENIGKIEEPFQQHDKDNIEKNK